MLKMNTNECKYSLVKIDLDTAENGRGIAIGKSKTTSTRCRNPGQKHSTDKKVTVQGVGKPPKKIDLTYFGLQTRPYLESCALKRMPTRKLSLRLEGDPDACVVAFTSDAYDIYKVADAMGERGWDVPRMQRPPCVHVCVMDHTGDTLDAYLEDLRACAVLCPFAERERGRDGQRDI